MDRSPCVVTAPDGTTYAPVRAVVYGTGMVVLELRHKDGRIMGGASCVDRVTEGRRHATVYTPDGTWQVRDLCGCNSQYKAWKREWNAS